MWKRFDTIDDLPEGLWNSTVARRDASLDSRLIRTAEQLFPEASFRYWIREHQGIPSALFMGMIARDTPFYGIEGLDRKPFKSFSTGTPETTGLHLWYDDTKIERGNLLKEMTTEIHKLNDPLQAIVFRDFIDEAAKSWSPFFGKKDYRTVPILDVCELIIPETVNTLEGHIQTLTSKHRYQVTQYRAALDRSKYTVEPITDYLPHLQELYPLYVEVASRAHEYAAEPYPRDYFVRIKENFGDDALMLTIREKATGRFLGFMLLLYGRGSCVHQYIGFHKRDDLFLWHNLTLESIGNAIDRGIHRINMGVTHTQAKRKFGAVARKNVTFVKMIADENR